MNNKLLVAVAIFLQVFILIGQAKPSEFPDLQGPYLGQKPPGITPEIFAPGIISSGLYTRDMAISKAGDEIYFCIADGGWSMIFVARLLNNHWTEPAIASFSGKGFLDFEPHISPDGDHFFFLSNRPPPGLEARKGWAYQHIWMMTRTGKDWSEPQMVAAPVNTEESEFFPSVSNDNGLYFTRNKKNGVARIYKAKFANNRYLEPEMLPFAIPEKGLLFNAFVSPQEDYLITCALNIDT
jgi:hypothetical protein